LAMAKDSSVPLASCCSSSAWSRSRAFWQEAKRVERFSTFMSLTAFRIWFELAASIASTRTYVIGNQRSRRVPCDSLKRKPSSMTKRVGGVACSSQESSKDGGATERNHCSRIWWKKNMFYVLPCRGQRLDFIRTRGSLQTGVGIVSCEMGKVKSDVPCLARATGTCW
jgi:hypothetical protein